MTVVLHQILRIILGLVIGTILWTVVVRGAFAAPLQPPDSQQGCRTGVFDQRDMAGRYEMSAMLVEVYPCGGSVVWWINDYGEHQSTYFAAERMKGGGIISHGYMPDPVIRAYLDSVRTLAIKPAEPGWIQVATVSDDDRIVGLYRLRKTR